ncbi:MAG: glycoside hydrolase family 57 protein [Phycisphaerales bacterium]|nr:glycoside hydrolase family 57 protein [Phycisphaerales bacterium]
MVAVCFYFQVHQPYRLRRYSVFDTDPFYFDDRKNAELCRRVAERCYRPATELLIDLCRRHAPHFKVSFSISGTILDQLESFSPDILDLFKRLVDTGACELLAEPYHHSLAFLYSRDEFTRQVDLHTERIASLFGVQPTVFCNTELVYNNDLAYYVASMGRFRGILCEGVDRILGYRSPNHVYRPPNTDASSNGRPFALLLKNYRLSDDIAFRFSNRDWPHWPLTAETFADWIARIDGEGEVCNLFMDYETFGEHQNVQTGIFDFLEQLPEAVLGHNGSEMSFKTPSECLDAHEPVDEYDVPHMISWADTERDLSAWVGNAMQSNALHELFKLESPIRDKLASAMTLEEKKHAGYILTDWRKLTSSDHVYYMCTKHYADGVVHKYFNPYASPYDGYINFMNVLDNLRARLNRSVAAASATSAPRAAAQS